MANDDEKVKIPKSNLNDSPIRLDEFDIGYARLKLKTPRKVKPEIDPSGTLLCLIVEDLGIDCFAFSREELLEELINEMELLWQNFAQEKDDAVLADSAKKLKYHLLQEIHELPNAD